MEKVLIIDGHNLLFRMFFGIPQSIKNNQGQELKGVLGFLGGINRLLHQFHPQYLIVVFDTETSIGDRLQENKDYKQNRIDYSLLSDDLNPFTQLPFIKQALSSIGILYHEAVGYEADDYIASLCEALVGYNKIIVSTDKDFLQLVTDSTLAYNPIADIIYTPEKVFEKFQVTPTQIIDYKTLVGDASDHIKGVPGIGPKTAVKILQVGTLDEILMQIKPIDDKWYQKISVARDIILSNRRLIMMKRNLGVHIDMEQLRCSLSSIQPRQVLRDCNFL